MSSQRDDILERLRSVPYPGFTRDIVTAGVVRDVVVDAQGVVEVQLEIPPASKQAEPKIRQGIEAVLKGIAEGDQLRFSAPSGRQGSSSLNVVSGGPQRNIARDGAADGTLIPGVKNVVAVASGKGGVGKSTVAVNLAISLASQGYSVGLLDADIYGPSIPLMMGRAGARPTLDPSGRRLIPFERFGIRFMSLGFLVEAESAVIWRGPMVMKALEQLLKDVVWGDLDFLILDMPPGTGDAQLTVSQRVQLAGAVIVSTPQDVALADAIKGISMFRKVEVPVLGLIENMSTFCCPNCNTESPIFGAGGAEKAAAELKVPFLGAIPLDGSIREAGDAGEPIVHRAPDSPHADSFRSIAIAVAERAMQSEGDRPSFLETAAKKLGLKRS